jgi:hypothetical protein
MMALFPILFLFPLAILSTLGTLAMKHEPSIINLFLQYYGWMKHASFRLVVFLDRLIRSFGALGPTGGFRFVRDQCPFILWGIVDAIIGFRGIGRFKGSIERFIVDFAVFLHRLLPLRA